MTDEKIHVIMNNEGAKTNLLLKEKLQREDNARRYKAITKNIPSGVKIMTKTKQNRKAVIQNGTHWFWIKITVSDYWDNEFQTQYLYRDWLLQTRVWTSKIKDAAISNIKDQDTILSMIEKMMEPIIKDKTEEIIKNISKLDRWEVFA